MDQSHPDPQAVVFNLPTEGYWTETFNDITDSLPDGLAREVREIMGNYVLAYWVDGARDRLHGRTVAQVIAEYKPPPGLPVVAEGETDGMRFTLYGPPPADEQAG